MLDAKEAIETEPRWSAETPPAHTAPYRTLIVKTGMQGGDGLYVRCEAHAIQ